MAKLRSKRKGNQKQTNSRSLHTLIAVAMVTVLLCIAKKKQHFVFRRGVAAHYL